MLREKMNGNLSSPVMDQRRRAKDLQTLKRVAQAFRPYKSQVVLVLIAILVTTVLNLVVPLLVPLVFDDALAGRKIGHLVFYAVLMVGATLAASLVEVGQTYLKNRVGQSVMRDFRNRLYEHLQNMSLRFFTSMRTGEIQSRLSNDVNAAQAAVTDTFIQAITNVVTIIGTVLAMLYLSPVLTLVAFIMLPLFLWFTFRVGNARRSLSRATQQSIASLSALMQETLSVSGILLIKIFGRKKFAQQQFEAENENLTTLTIRRQLVGIWFFMFMGMFGTITPVILYIVAGSLFIYSPGSHITIGSLIAFLTLLSRFFGPFSQLLTIQTYLQGDLALFDRIFEYLDLPLEIHDAPEAITLSPDDVSGRVEFRNVSFSYGPNNFAILEEPERGPRRRGPARAEERAQPAKVPQQVIKNVSFTIQPGQLAALVGPSGAGKTTLTYLLPRLYDVESGSIEIDGHNVKDISMESLSNLIGSVTQETYLFHASIRQNLLYVQPEATEEDLIAATKAAAIYERILELDDGFDTVVGERGYRLSGGEKQRLAIARVLLKNPRILILDEATSSLDTHSERLIQAALEPLMKGRTTIAIAHRLSTILAADLILVVDKGEIVERGTHEELLAYQGLYARLYREQFAQQLHDKAAV